MREKYETDLTDEQWEVIAPLFSNMRKYKWEKRELVNAVLYLVKTGCQWRNLPHDFPPVFTVHSFYRRARLSGLWDRILEHLAKITRQKASLSEMPTQALIDSQCVKTTGAVEQKGFDIGKNERSKTANRHRRYGLSFVGRDSQSQFARYENGIKRDIGQQVWQPSLIRRWKKYAEMAVIATPSFTRRINISA